LLLAGLACLFPVSLYCLYLALLHNRRNPTLIAGPWDFAGTLIALSGFLLIGGTVLIFSLHTAARDAWLRSAGVAQLYRVHRQLDALSLGIWGAYTLALLGGSAWLIWSRGDHTSVYNITPDEMEEVVEKMCARIDLSFGRRGPRLLLGYDRPAPKSTTDSFEVPADVPRPSGPAPRASVDLDGSSAMRFVSLRWVYAAPGTRQELEAELARELARFEASPGPVAGWLVTAAGALMILMIFGLATFLLIVLR
jgi:hypothetical protein